MTIPTSYEAQPETDHAARVKRLGRHELPSDLEVWLEYVRASRSRLAGRGSGLRKERRFVRAMLDSRAGRLRFGPYCRRIGRRT